MELLIGADPEFFVYKDGKPVSAYGLIEGTKKNPIPVNGGAIQVDGMALEFNINPAKTFNEFNRNIDSVLDEFRKVISPEYEFSFTPVADFGEEYLAQQPEEAVKLGCEPDFNAWDGGNVNPIPDVKTPFRTASGHIHLGWTEGQDINDPEHIEACNMIVKQLDAVLGTASIIWDRDNRRRQLYGKAGAYRPKSYGVEYRVMSNAWLNDCKLREFVFQAAHEAFDSLLNGRQRFGDRQNKYINDDDVQSCFSVSSYWYWNEHIHNLHKAWDDGRVEKKIKANTYIPYTVADIAKMNDMIIKVPKRRKPLAPIGRMEVMNEINGIRPGPVDVVVNGVDWENVVIDRR